MGSLKSRLAEIHLGLRSLDHKALFIAGVILALLLRWSLFEFVSGDFVHHIGPWSDFIRSHGGFRAFRYNFSDYTPPYLYLLTLALYLPIQALYAAKLLSVIFDLLLALTVLLIVRLKYRNKTVSIISFFVVLFAPTILFNSALWAQSDVVYTTLLLAAIYFVMKKQVLASAVLIALSFAVKSQTVFIFPLFFILYLRKQFPLRNFFLIPLVYLLLILPAFFIGRPFSELISIYWRQAGQYPALTLNAANLYQWLPNDPDHFGKFGILFAAANVFLLCYLCYRSTAAMDRDLILRLALVSAILVPFTLPHMHERYFYPADVLSIVYAFYFPRYFFVPLLIIFASFFSYFPFLFGREIFALSHLALLMMIALVVTLVDLVLTLYPNLRHVEAKD